MNRVYMLSWDTEQVCYVVAPSPTRAKAIAMKESPKAQQYDYISLNARQSDLDGVDTSGSGHLFDVETYQDVLNEETRWYWSQQ